MRVIKKFALLLCLMISLNSIAQQTAPKGVEPVTKKGKKSKGSSPGLTLFLGVGTANYFGDLMQYNRFYSQPSYAVSAGINYAITERLGTRFQLGFQNVKASDSKNKGDQYKARNLSFKSNILDAFVAVDYSFFSLQNTRFTPFVTAGIGFMSFDPYAEDAAGNKQKLQPLGTEGQGLAAYPNRKMYQKSTYTFPLGFGFKYKLNRQVVLQLEFNYRFTGTDYLDDVSLNSYPDKTLLDARNPVTSKFTWRGNEVGGAAYPQNLALPRGNPSYNDAFYTTQLKMVFKL